MILVDTSAWAEFDRATGSAVDRALTDLIGTTDEVAVTGPILLRSNPVVLFDGAVRIYRSCRRAGVTPRGMIDCMIAAVAISSDVPVLTRDRDLAANVEVVDLRLHPAS